MKKKDVQKAYICGIDWQCEIPFGANDVQLYSSVKALKKARTCWRECGIVELKIQLSKWVVKQDLLSCVKKGKKDAKGNTRI